MAAPAAPDEILDVNRRYHDVAARDYDAKWGISFGEIGRRQVLGKVRKLIGDRPGPFPRALEIGSTEIHPGEVALRKVSSPQVGDDTFALLPPQFIPRFDARGENRQVLIVCHPRLA